MMISNQTREQTFSLDGAGDALLSQEGWRISPYHRSFNASISQSAESSRAKKVLGIGLVLSNLKPRRSKCPKRPFFCTNRVVLWERFAE